MMQYDGGREDGVWNEIPRAKTKDKIVFAWGISFQTPLEFQEVPESPKQTLKERSEERRIGK